MLRKISDEHFFIYEVILFIMKLIFTLKHLFTKFWKLIVKNIIFLFQSFHWKTPIYEILNVYSEKHYFFQRHSDLISPKLKIMLKIKSQCPYTYIIKMKCKFIYEIIITKRKFTLPRNYLILERNYLRNLYRSYCTQDNLP